MGKHVKKEIIFKKVKNNYLSKWQKVLEVNGSEKCVQKKELITVKENTKKLVKMVEAAEELKKKDGQDSVMVEDKIDIETTNKNGDAEVMDTSAKLKHSKKSLKDEHGNYPVWMSMRKIQSQKRKNKAAAKRRGKVSKKK